MTYWQLQQAKQRLSALVLAARAEPQIITVHGREKAVVMSHKLFRKIAKIALEARIQEREQLENNNKMQNTPSGAV
jgi:prevent-host-death family protein